MRVEDLWLFLPFGYLFSVAIETPVLVFGLSPRHTLRQRLFAGLWLTACTYPIVVLVLPALFEGTSRAAYLVVAETFAPAAECALFWLAFGERSELVRRSMWRDFAAIVAANLASFAAGEVAGAFGWFGLFG
ncbi:MAG TPA: hypothetical protein VLJ61_07825 [Pyrinomonadaceae bacterium]|nr:hypothetical protein [Pyrinomonadaceae bacterium]